MWHDQNVNYQRILSTVRRHTALKYALAVISWLITLLVWHLFEELVKPIPAALFFINIVLVSWGLGFGPAALVTVLSILFVNFFSLSPGRFIPLGWIPLVQSGIIFGTALLISYVQELRNRAEQTAAEQRERLRVTLLSIGEGVITVDAFARVRMMNPAAETLTGWDQASAVGKPAEAIFNIINEQTRQVTPNPLARALKEKRTVGLANHTLLIQKDGQEISIDDGAAPILDSNGEVTGAVLIFRDVTERRIAERATEASEMRFRRIADTAPVMIWMAGTDMLCYFVNEARLNFTGRELQQELGMGWAKIVHPDDYQTCVDTFRTSFEARQSFQMEYRLRRHDGVYRWIMDRGTPQYDANGAFLGFIGSSVDIDEQRRQAQSEQFLREAGDILATSLEYEQTIQNIAFLAVQDLASWCAVDLLETEDGGLFLPRRIAVAHKDPAKVALAHELYERYPPLPATQDENFFPTLGAGKSVLIAEISPELAERGARDAEHREIIRSLELRSAMLVPMMVRGKLIGVITFIASETDRRFNSDDLALAERLTEQAAQAIDNALLYREAQDARQRAELAVYRLDRLQTMRDLLSRVGAEAEAISIILEEGRQACGAFAASIVQLDEERTSLSIAQSIGYQPATIANWQSIPLSIAAPATDAVNTGHAVWLASQKELHERYPNLVNIVLEGKAWTAVPLVNEGIITGALLLSFDHPHSFDAAEKSFIISLAQKSAQAIERSRLLQQEQKMRSELQRQRERAILLSEASQLAASPPNLLRQTNHVARLLIPSLADWVTIHVLDNDAVTQVAVAARKLETMLTLQDILKQFPSPDARPNLRRVIETGQPLHFPEFTEKHMAAVARGNEEHLRLLHKVGTTSAVIVPLRVRDRVLGAMTLGYTESGRRYAMDDVTFLTELAGQASLTFDNARLYQFSQQQRERLAVTLSSIGDAVISTDTDGRINYMNGVAESLTGWTLEEASGHKLDDVFNVVNEYTREPAENPVIKVLSEGIVVGLANHTILIAKNGVEVSIDDSAAPMRDESGKIIGVVLIFRDISERRKAEARFAATLDRTRDLSDICIQIGLTQTPADVLRALLSSRFINGINQAAIIVFSQIWGETVPDSYEVRAVLNPDAGLPGLGENGVLKNSLFGKVCSAEKPLLLDNLQMDEEIEPAIRQQFALLDVKSVYLLPLLSGRDCFGMLLLYRTDQAWDADDHQHLQILVTQLSAAMNNLQLLTGESRARREAERADQVKLQFLAMISHELRTPLASIKGFVTSLLATDVKWDANSQREFLSIINEEADRLTGLIDQLLDLSRLQAGTLGIQPQPVPMHHIVGAAVAQLSALTARHQLVVEVDQQLPLVFADKERIAQVIVNLVHNAVKYAPEDSLITISALEAGGFLQVCVDDEGPGIPSEERTMAFEAFRQVESPQLQKAKGAGLGLAICRGLVEAHGGTIDIVDKSSAGLRIYFTLPLAVN